MNRINNVQLNDAHDIDAVVPMQKLIEYSDNYSKTSGILCQYWRDEPALALALKLKKKKTGEKSNNGTKNIEIMVP